jgi:hypothetical protein
MPARRRAAFEDALSLRPTDKILKKGAARHAKEAAGLMSRANCRGGYGDCQAGPLIFGSRLTDSANLLAMPNINAAHVGKGSSHCFTVADLQRFWRKPLTCVGVAY